MSDVRELIHTVRLLDLGSSATDSLDQARIEYIEIRRWNPGGRNDNEQDDRVTALFRELLMQEIRSHSSEEIATAALDLLAGVPGVEGEV